MRLKNWKAVLWSDNYKYKAAKIKIKACDYHIALRIARAIFDRAGAPNNIEVKSSIF